MKNFITYALLVFLFFACGEDKTSQIKEKVEIPPRNVGLINWAFFSSEGMQNISFPIWFNDSFIIEKNIKGINLSIKELEPQDDSTFHDTIPSRFYDIDFSSERVKIVYVKEYHQEIVIEEQWFKYRHDKDSLGYSLPDITNNVVYEENDFLPIFSTLQNAQHYKRLKFLKIDSSTIHYENTLSTIKERHVFIIDSSDWNVHFIDQKFEHPEKIVFYFGVPSKHIESFRIKNLVEKTQISSTKYFENNCIYQHSTYNNSFENRKTFLYDKTGRVTGFIDSLIVEPNDFIEGVVSKIKYEDGLPLAITSYKSYDSLYKSPIKEIMFKYNFNE